MSNFLPARNFTLRCSILILFLCCSAIPISLRGQAKLQVVGGNEFNLGVIPEDTIVHKTLIVKNNGTDTLTVENVRTSCGCTVAKPASDRVAPNDSMEIPVSFNTKNFDGPVKKEVYFETNDTTVKKADIVLLATIKAMIELRPTYLNFYNLKLHDAVTRTDTIRNNTTVQIRIDSIIVHDPQITANIRDSLLSPNQITILESTLNSRKYGNVLGQIDIKTNYPAKPLISISYVGYVKK